MDLNANCKLRPSAHSSLRLTRGKAPLPLQARSTRPATSSAARARVRSTPTQVNAPVEKINLDPNMLPGNSPNCCTGSYNTAATCPASRVQYYSYFSESVCAACACKSLTSSQKVIVRRRLRLPTVGLCFIRLGAAADVLCRREPLAAGVQRVTSSELPGHILPCKLMWTRRRLWYFIGIVAKLLVLYNVRCSQLREFEHA